MKRYVILLASAVLFFSVAGCQKTNSGIMQDETTTDLTETSETKTSETSVQTTTPATSAPTTTSQTESETSEALSGRYAVQQFDEVIIETIVYSKGVNFNGDPAWQRADIYMPAGDDETGRPLMIWLHGGGFTRGNDRTQKSVVTLSAEFAKKGYVCMSADYRIRDNPDDDWEGTIKDAVEDIVLLSKWIEENHESYGIDKSRIIVGGSSAGGITAVNFCLKDETGGLEWNKIGIIGLVNLWGSPELESLQAEIDSSDPPALFIHGTADDVVPYINSEMLMDDFIRKGVDCELVPLDGAGHTPLECMDVILEKTTEFAYRLITGQ